MGTCRRIDINIYIYILKKDDFVYSFQFAAFISRVLLSVIQGFLYTASPHTSCLHVVVTPLIN